MNDFSNQVIKIIKRIPSGRIATYGQVAELAGKPHGARGVAWILHSSSSLYGLPWHRVLNSKGRISFPVDSILYQKQLRLLKREGVEFSSDQRLDLRKYQWARKPKPKKAKVSKKPQMFS